MMILALIIVTIRNYSGIKLNIVLLICLFKALEAFSDVLYGIMQKKECLYKSGQSLTLKSVLGLLFFFVTNIITKDLVLSIIVLNFINIIIILFWDIRIINRIKNVSLLGEMSSKTEIIGILKREFFVFVNSFAGVYILNSSKYAIDVYLTETFQAVFGYIMMPATVMILFTQFILLPFLNKFKELYKNGKIKEFEILGRKIKSSVLAFGFLAVIIAYLIGPEVLSFIYGVNLLEYRGYLMIIIASYILYSISYVNLVILTTMRKTFIQFVVYVISMLVAFIVSNILVKNYGILGATIAIAITLTVQFVLYIMITKLIMYKERIRLETK